MYSAAKSHVVSVLGPPPTRYAVHMTLELNRTASTAEQLNSLLTQIMENFSVSDHEGPLTDEVEAFLNEQEHLTVRRHGDTVVASTDFGKPSRVILAGHLDTVPVIDNFPPKWLEPGDSLIREEIAHAHPEDRVLWGRGATDMKASDAVMLYLAATLDGRTPETTPKVDLTYVFYDHEEVVAEKNGLRKVVEAHPDWITGDFAIIGEPTNSGIEGGCNGTIRFDVVTHGVAAHSARAWMGENAIHKAADILNRLNAYEPATVNVDGLDYREGLNATLISGGKGTNVIPDECRVHVNYRFAPDKSLAEAKALMMGADAGAELGNGEHVATGGVFEGYGIVMKDESPSLVLGTSFQVTTLDLNDVPKTDEGKVDYAQDFFGKSCNLTVSGQLEGELGALSLGRIYTFGPTFRAENSNTPRHASEFWMIEPEAAFYELEDNMELAEDFLKYLIRYALDNCAEDLEFMNKMWDKGLLERLNFVLHNDFKRLDYTEGVEILKASGRKFEFPCDWGCDLQSEHERYLVEEHFKRPVILINYPKDIKAFYMKQNDDGKTVRAMDVLFPGIGEIIGGSEREADYGKLHARVQELGMNEKELWWYLDTRRWGSAPHSGFGLGFDRLLLFVTGMTNIRDVQPFPRTPKNAEF